MVEKLLNLNSNGNERNVVNKAKLYIPWAVLDELDHLKLAGKRPTNPNMKLEFNARKAISFLHQKLSSNSHQVNSAWIFLEHTFRLQLNCVLYLKTGFCTFRYVVKIN